MTWTHPYARDSSVVKHTDPTSVGRVSSPLDPRPLHYAALPARLCNSQPCALNVDLERIPDTSSAPDLALDLYPLPFKAPFVCLTEKQNAKREVTTPAGLTGSALSTKNFSFLKTVTRFLHSNSWSLTGCPKTQRTCTVSASRCHVHQNSSLSRAPLRSSLFYD